MLLSEGLEEQFLAIAQKAIDEASYLAFNGTEHAAGLRAMAIKLKSAADRIEQETTS